MPTVLGIGHSGDAGVPCSRCLNCGWIEDPVMRANRLANSDQSGIIPAVARSPRLPGRRSAEMPTS
jgi:hypothetical protein